MNEKRTIDISKGKQIIDRNQNPTYHKTQKPLISAVFNLVVMLRPLAQNPACIKPKKPLISAVFNLVGMRRLERPTPTSRT